MKKKAPKNQQASTTTPKPGPATATTTRSKELHDVGSAITYTRAADRKTAETALTVIPLSGPQTIVQQAIKEGASVDVMERLLAMQERYEATQARKAFDAAMAAVKALLPKIMKSRTVDFTSQKGRTHYRYEDLPAIQKAIDPVLGEHGLSYRWTTDNSDPKRITVACIITHAQGHRERAAELSGAPDETGNKNDIQGVGSAVTYLQRYTLKAAFGLAAAEDTDGRVPPAGRNQPAPQHEHPDLDKPITVGWKDTNTGEKHYGQLERLIAIQRKSGRTDEEVHMWLKVVYGYGSRKEITRRHYDDIVDAISQPGPLPVPDDLPLPIPRGYDREPGSDDE